MLRETSVQKIVLRLLKAWGVGLFFAGTVVLPADHLSRLPNYDQVALMVYAMFAAKSLLLAFTLGALLSFPFLLIAAVVAVVFDSKIARYPAVFVGLAPLVSAAVITAVDVLPPTTPWENTEDIFILSMESLLSRDTWLFVCPITAAAAYYCVSRAVEHKRQQRRPTAS